MDSSFVGGGGGGSESDKELVGEMGGGISISGLGCFFGFSVSFSVGGGRSLGDSMELDSPSELTRFALD